MGITLQLLWQANYVTQDRGTRKRLKISRAVGLAPHVEEVHPNCLGSGASVSGEVSQE